MRYRSVAPALAAIAAVGVLAGCASPHGTASATSAAATTEPAVSQTYAAPAPSPTPDLEMRICADFDNIVMPGIAATLHDAIGTGTPNPPYPRPRPSFSRTARSWVAGPCSRGMTLATRRSPGTSGRPGWT